MDGLCSLSSSLNVFLIIAGILSVCAVGNSQTDMEYNIKCQASVMKLECRNKSYMITIVSVFYGRKLPGGKLCRSPPASYLTDEIMCSDNVLVQVEEFCNQKSSCNFTLDAKNLGASSCPNVHKYMDIKYSCDDSRKFIRKAVVRPVSPTPLYAMATSIITTSAEAMTSHVSSSEAIQPTSAMVANVDTLITTTSTHQSLDATNTSGSSSLSVSWPHSVSVTTVSHTQALPATTVAIENPTLKTTKPTSKTYEHSISTISGQHGTMKLFRFILSFHIVHEEAIRKHTASSLVWFMFGLLVGLLIMIAVLVYYRVRLARQGWKNKPNKVTYLKQKDCSDGTFEEKVILHPKELEALEMESQLGESV